MVEVIIGKMANKKWTIPKIDENLVIKKYNNGKKGLQSKLTSDGFVSLRKFERGYETSKHDHEEILINLNTGKVQYEAEFNHNNHLKNYSNMSTAINVSSEEVIAFRNEMVKWVDTLQQYHDELQSQILELSESWNDWKFEIFVEDFRTTQNKILEIKERFDDWTTKKLPIKIDEIIKYEQS
jgi:uncharacterized protein YukE